MKSLPNILTLSRILVIPLIVLSFYFEDSKLTRIISSSLFLYACITDFLDGYLARTLSYQSSLGKFLDPVADKLIVGSVILLLVHEGRADILPSLAIITREILVSGLREFLAEIKISVPVSKLGKIKTFMQMTAIFLILLGSKGSKIEIIDVLGSISLWIAAILTVITGYVYLKAGLIYMKEEE